MKALAVLAEPAVLVVEPEILRAELPGLATSIAVEAADFVVVLTADANSLMGEPAPICLSGCDALVRNKVYPN